jgi:hypothetical protein
VTSKSIEVLDSGQGLPSAKVVVAPNPWSSGAPLVVLYPVSPGCWGACDLYDLAGERICGGADPSGSGRITLAPPFIANGIYLLEFRQMQGSDSVSHSLNKVAVVQAASSR